MDQRNIQFMFYGLASAWLVLATFAITLVVRERKITDEIRRLKNLLDDRERK